MLWLGLMVRLMEPSLASVAAATAPPTHNINQNHMLTIPIGRTPQHSSLAEASIISELLVAQSHQMLGQDRASIRVSRGQNK